MGAELNDLEGVCDLLKHAGTILGFALLESEVHRSRLAAHIQPAILA